MKFIFTIFFLAISITICKADKDPFDDKMQIEQIIDNAKQTNSEIQDSIKTTQMANTYLMPPQELNNGEKILLFCCCIPILLIVNLFQ
mgnify:FL=1